MQAKTIKVGLVLKVLLTALFLPATLVFSAEPPDVQVEPQPGARGQDPARNNDGRRREAPGMADRMRQVNISAALRNINCLDAVKLTLAQVYAGSEKFDEAIAVLNRVIAESKDQEAVGYAHLGLGMICQAREKPQEAEAEFIKVTGPAVALAVEMMITGVEPENRAAKLEELLVKVEDPLAKVLLIRRLTSEYRRAEDAEKLVDLDARASKMLTAEEAAKALELEKQLLAVEEQARNNGRDRRDRGRFQPGQMAAQMREQMEARIKELDADGNKEEAAQMRERLERMQRFADHFGGRRGRDRNNNNREEEPAPAKDKGADVF